MPVNRIVTWSISVALGLVTPLLACVVLSCGTFLAARAAAPDGVVSRGDIEAALAPAGATAAAGTSGAATAPSAPRTRGIVIKAAAEERRGVIDLNIPFELNSAVLQPQAVAQLEQLEAALSSATLAHARFLVAGHTDSSGDDGYNRRLSLKRAETVRDWLAGHGVDAQRLETAGYGSDRPATPQDPRNPANRRVEIRSLGAAP